MGDRDAWKKVLSVLEVPHAPSGISFRMERQAWKPILCHSPQTTCPGLYPFYCVAAMHFPACNTALDELA